MLNFEIIVPFFNGHKYIDKLIQSIPTEIQITIVDDHSETPLNALPYSNVKIIKSDRKGYFAGTCNLGMLNTEKDVLILNQDTHFTGTKWLTQLENPLDEGFSYIGERIKGTRADWPNGYLHGTFLYITRELIDAIGVFDSKNFLLWGTTAEYQLRAARAGFKIKPLEQVDDFIHEREPGQQFGSSIRTLLKREPENRGKLVHTPPLVSVVIVTHNYTSWMKSTINSLIGGETDLGLWPQQTFGGFEVIIVDDCSTDNTPEILAEICDSWKGVRSIRLDRPKDEVWSPTKDRYIGKPVALNVGIKAAYGKYIMVLDADDMVKPDRLERFYDAMEANPHMFVYDNFQLFNNSGEIIDYIYPGTYLKLDRSTGQMIKRHHPKAGERTKLPKAFGSKYDLDACKHKNQVHFSIMFSKKAWKEIGGYSENFKWGREDWAMAVNLGLHGYCGYKLDDYHGLLYRRGEQNRTNVNTSWNWMQYFRSQMKHTFPEAYKGEVHMGCCGRAANITASKTDAFAKAATTYDIGTEGTSLIKYIGGRSVGESFTIYGFSTGTQYRVTPGTNFRADNRDLISKDKKYPGVLQMYEVNKFQFELVDEPKPEPNAPVEEVVTVVQDFDEPQTAENLGVISDEVVEEDTTVDFTVLDGTVAVFDKAIRENDYVSSDMVLLLAYEVSHKNRKSVIGKIESYEPSV